jgi:dipeptidyl aminopeptidase/acylaminoacyl peptidase
LNRANPEPRLFRFKLYAFLILITINHIGGVMNYLKLFFLSLIFVSSNLFAEELPINDLLKSVLYAQEIPINDLLYSVTDYEFTLSPSGKYLASIKKFPNNYTIIITDIKSGVIKTNIPLGEYRVFDLNWISETRISYEQAGVLFAINIDGTENQQLMSIWKDEKHRYYSTYNYYNFQSTRMVNALNDDYEHILVETRGIDGFPIIYKLNIFTGEKEEIENGKKYDIDYWLADRTGQIRFGIQKDNGKIKFFAKNDRGKWESKNELNLDMDGNSFINQKLNFLDFDYDKNIIYIASSMDSPRWRILAYDIQKKTFVNTVLEDEKYDIGNPINEDTKLLFLDSEAKLIGIRYEREKPYTKWFYKKFQDYQDLLKSMYPEYDAEIFGWNKDASIILVRLFSDAQPGRFIIYDSQDKKIKILCTYANELLNYKLSNSHLIKYKTRDGYEIEGYLNLPLKEGKKFPFIIIPHGGPWARDYWDYDPVVQFFTNQGYGVLKMNFRGSTGYGIDHLLSGVRQISGLMIDDIADGAKWVIDQNYADSSKIFLYGHSYGGYAALESIIRYPEMYRAAVCIGSPTDIIELMDYYKDNKYKFSYEFWKTTVGDPKDEKRFLKSISPIYNIKKIDRPIFFFHGEKDETVPVSQTEEFIKEAKDLGKIFEYKIIKDEDHSISENRNMEFVLKKSIEFFKKNSTDNK